MFDRDTVGTMLAATSPFANFSKSELKTIGQKTEHRKLETGEMLTRQGQFGTELIVVLKGTASVDISGTIVAELGAGEVIGEMALLDHGPRTATITATSPMEVAALSIKGFDDLTKQSPALWRAIATGLARRLREEDRSYHN
jgi:CRP/FNR family transcriptional regulator, cyclic AMP receptor protein